MPSINDYIDATVQNPVCKVTYRGAQVNYVESVDLQRAYDQPCATAKVVISMPIQPPPDNSSLLQISHGYDGYYKYVFTGYIDSMTRGRFPDTWELSCRDVLKKAVDTWLDDQGKVTPDGSAATYNQQQAETVVSDLLSKAGLTVEAGTSSFTVGDIHETQFKLVSIMDAVQQVADLIGWRVWADPEGNVYFQYQRPLPSTSPTWTYRYNKNILEYTFETTDRDTRNRVVIVGYQAPDSDTPIRAAVHADSAYINSPEYRTATVSSELIDTQDMANWMAEWMLDELNHLKLIWNGKVVGNPLLDVGRTIRVIDNMAIPVVNRDMFIFSLTSHIDGKTGEYINQIVAVANDAYDSVPNWEPNPPGDDTPPVTPPDPPPANVMGDGSRTYLATDKGVLYTDNFLTESPTWTAINTGLTGDALNVIRFLFDPWSSDGISLTGAYIVTKDGVYKNSSLPSGAWEQVLSPAEMQSLIGANAGASILQFTRELAVPITRENYVAVIGIKSLSPSGHKKYYVYSTDGGATWQANTTNYWFTSGAPAANGFDTYAYLHYSDNSWNKVYLSVWSGSWWNSSSHAEITRLFVSEDSGATFTYEGTMGGSGNRANYLHFPYANSEGIPYEDTKVWRSYMIVGGTKEIEYTDTFPDPISHTETYPSDYTSSGCDLTGIGNSYLMDTCTWNDNYVYVLLVYGSTYSMAYTNDGGATWEFVNITSVPGESKHMSALSALSGNALVCITANCASGTPGTARAYLTQDGGATWGDRTGDANTVLASISEVRSIVPDWVKVLTE